MVCFSLSDLHHSNWMLRFMRRFFRIFRQCGKMSYVIANEGEAVQVTLIFISDYLFRDLEI